MGGTALSIAREENKERKKENKGTKKKKTASFAKGRLPNVEEKKHIAAKIYYLCVNTHPYED